MAWNTITPADANDLCSQLLQFSDTGKYACRGHSRRWGRLISSLDRILENKPSLTEDECAKYEFRCMYVFHQRASNYLLQSELTHLDGLMGTLLLMQHYGAPTRLLDWTRSPWVAAYFCVLSQTAEEGEIWIFDYDKLEDIVYRLKFPRESEDIAFAQFSSIWRARRFPRTPDSWIATFTPSPMSPRMMAQQSLFTVASLRHNHNELIDDCLDSSTDVKVKLIISPEIKKNMKERLFGMNVTSSSLFPGVDGLGRFIYQLMETWIV